MSSCIWHVSKSCSVNALIPFRMPYSSPCGKPSSSSCSLILRGSCPYVPDEFIIFAGNCQGWGRSVSDVTGGCSACSLCWWPACQDRMPACSRQWPFLPLLWGLPVFSKCKCALKSSDSGTAAQVCACSKSYTKSKAKTLHYLYCLYSLLLCMLLSHSGRSGQLRCPGRNCTVSYSGKAEARL